MEVVRMRLNDAAKRAHDIARAKGFWDKDAGDVAKKLLLIHSEVSEAAEELRTNSMYLELLGGKTEGLIPELADVLIRTLDLLHHLGMDVEQVVERKMRYNAKRSYKHGKGW